MMGKIVMKNRVCSFGAGILALLFAASAGWASECGVAAVSASAGQSSARNAFDGSAGSFWAVSKSEASSPQWLMFTLQNPGDVNGIEISSPDLSVRDAAEGMRVFVTYDPMNPGDPVRFDASGGDGKITLSFAPKYGAHVRLEFDSAKISKPFSISEIRAFAADKKEASASGGDRPYMDADMPIDARVEALLSVMTPADKMELIREGWGIPGIPKLGVPAITKVEAVHGFSYGSGATIFPQAIAMGATWDKGLVEEVGIAVGDETVAAGTKQAWSPVLDVAQDARWGRCEETFGEDPVLVSELGGAWIKGYQSRGLWTTPKHFGGHGAPLGGRDSHDIGLSEREMREVHLVPFRHAIKNYDCQSVMMAYSDYLGEPVAKSRELLKGILRDEWGFDGFIVSDCGAISNMTDKKHYTARDKVEAANLALAAGIATNCGDTYNDKAVIEAAKDGRIDPENLDFVCRTMLKTMFRAGLFEAEPLKKLDWNRVYPGWNTPEHRELARRAARESIVMLKNEGGLLPLGASSKKIAVIGPGADDLQPGDYTPKLRPGQLKSVLSGIREAAGGSAEVVYEKGCSFTGDADLDIAKAVAAAKDSDVAVLVLGDCSTSEAINNVKKTSGENNDWSSLILPGRQQELLEAVCGTGKPVVLVLQAGRPYDLSYASEKCGAILVNWLPGQEGGPATADVLFGKYNPAGRLPMTFPRSVSQLPLYYNFKTSGRRYNYVDMPFTPLYRFGYGLSYTTFEYSGLKAEAAADGSLEVSVTVKNTGGLAGDEVVQLYLTDMYASVKTRVMELKDFERVHLKPGESRTVKFSLTPYQLSLLNENMDRVVEPGLFKVSVGGSSPVFKAENRIKDSVGYEGASQGLTASVDYPNAFAADFEIRILGVEENMAKNAKTVSVAVKNAGNLTDAGRISMYVDGRRTGETRHFELDPGGEKVVRFNIGPGEFKSLVFATKHKAASLDSGSGK